MGEWGAGNIVYRAPTERQPSWRLHLSVCSIHVLNSSDCKFQCSAKEGTGMLSPPCVLLAKASSEWLWVEPE